MHAVIDCTRNLVCAGGASMMRVRGPGHLLLGSNARNGRRAASFASALLTFSLLLSFSARPASAGTCNLSSATTWIDGNGNWSTDGNWNPATAPDDSGTNVCITDGSSTVTLDTSEDVASLQLATGNALIISSGQTLNIDGSQLTNAGAITIQDGGAINETTGTISNTGTITIDGVSNHSVLNIDSTAAVTLTGGGTVALSSSLTNGNGVAFIAGFQGTLTNVNNTIEGDGNLGNGQLTLINEGTINANVSMGGLTLSTAGTTNTGTLEATNGGTLGIQSKIQNNGGTIQSSPGSTVVLQNGSSVFGGTLNSNGGTLETSGTVTLDGGASNGPLTIKGTFIINDNNQVNLNSGTINNDGAININAVSNHATLNVNQNDSVTLTGGGTVVLSSSLTNSNGEALIAGFQGTLTNVNNTIEGDGNLGNGQLTLINEGTINANVSMGGLTLSTAGTTNTGTLEATNGGTLGIQSSVQNNGGTIQSSPGSTVDLDNGSVVHGGTLNSNGGTMETNGPTVSLDGSQTSNPLTLEGTFTINDSNVVNIAGTIINSATINVIDTGDSAALQLSGDTTLSGHGTITLSSSSTNTAYLTNYPFVSTAPTLTNVDNTIQGAGNIGGNGGLIVINEGTVDANVSGGTLSITTNAFTNTGTLQATNGGILSIQSTINNVGGTISSGPGATVDLLNLGAGTVIYGGTLNSNGGSLAAANVVLDGSTFAPMTIQGTLTVGDTSTVYINGSIINQGTIAVNALTAGTVLYVPSGETATLTGGGFVKLSSTGSDTATFEGFQGTLINTNNTIEGNGFIGSTNNHLTFINNGIVDANVTGGVLYVSTSSTPSAPTTNTGAFEATNGGILGIQTIVDNQNGTILSSGIGSQVLLTSNGTTIQGGTLNTTVDGTMGSAGGTSDTLDGSTHGAITNLGTFTVNDNSNVNIVGTIVNQGTISIASVNNGATLNIPSGDTATLTGGGTVVLSTTGMGTANLNGFQGTLINTNNTIEGEGIIGSTNNHLTFINNGIVDANVTGGVLFVSTSSTPSAPTTNTGAFEATNGGILGIQTIVDNQNGTILSSGAGSQVLLTSNGATIQGGTLNTTVGGTMGSAGGTSDTLDGSTYGAITNLGTFTVNDNSFVYVNGSIINKGTINVVDLGNSPSLYLNGNTALSGGGTVVLSSSTGTANIGSCPVGCSGTYTLTNADNTIEGAGLIGQYGLSALVNGGTINANVAGGTLSVATGTITNTGMMQATGTGTLSIQTDVANTGGTIEARDTGSTVNFQNSPTITGGFIDGNGTINTSGSSFTLNGGTITPGLLASNTPGTLTVQGNFAQSGGSFNELIGSTSNYGILTVMGNATLSMGSGTALNITFATGFTPVTGDKFTILDATSLSGTFSNGSSFVEDGYNWTLAYQTVSGTQDAILTLGTAIGPTAVTATWTTGSGNWTTNSGSPGFNTNWTCSTSVTSGCVPNNSSPFNYTAVLNSAGNVMTLDGTDSPNNVTISNLNIEAGELDVNSGASLTVSGSTTVGASVDDVIRADGSTVNVGTLTNLASGVLTGGGYQAAEGGILNINGNVTTISGSTTAVILDGAGSKIANGAGDALAGLTNNNGGFLDVYDGASETITPGGGTFSNNGGTVTSAFGGSSLAVNGAFSNTNGGAVLVNGTGGGATVSVAGNFTSDSTAGTTTVTVENGGALNVTLGKTFTNQNGAQLLVESGGTLGVSGGFTNQALGSVQLNGGSAAVGGNLTNQTLAGIVVENGGSLSANSVTNSSNITVGLASAETANSSLAVTNAFTNSGTLTLAATVGTTTTQATVGSFNNTGNVQILSGTTLTSSGAYAQAAGGITTVEGTLTGTGGVNINGGTLEGTAIALIPNTGNINGVTTIGVGGTLLPGLSNTQSGTLIFGNSLNINGTLTEVLGAGTTGTGFSAMNITGSLSLGAASTLNLQQLGTFDPTVGTALTIATTGSSTAGLAFGSILNDTFNGGTEKWVVLDVGDNVELEAESNASVVTATWGPVAPSANSTGHWTQGSGAEFSCTSGGAATNCVPNNGTPADTTYNVVLDSNLHTLTLDSTDTPAAVTVSSLSMELGTLKLGSGGSLAVTGTTTVGLITTLQFAGGTLTQSGALINNGTIDGFGTITGGGSVTNNDYLGAAGGTLDLSGVNLTNLSAAGVLSGSAGGQFTAINGTLKLAGDIKVIEDVSVTISGTGSEFTDASNANALTGLTNISNGILSVGSGATLTTTGALTMTEGTAEAQDSSVLTIGGNLTSQTDGDVFASGGTININGALSNDATSTVFVDNGGSLTAASLTNAGTVSVGISPTASLTTTGNYTQTSGTTEVYSGGTITVQGAGGYSNNGGTTTVDNGGTISVTNSYTNGATTVVNGTLDAGSFSNLTGGTATVGAGGVLSVTDNFSNSGNTSVSGALSVGGFSNLSSGTVTVQGGSLTVTSAGFTNFGGSVLTMNGTGDTVNITGGITNAGTVSLTGSGDTLNADAFVNSGSVSIGAGETLTAESYGQQVGGSTDISGKFGTAAAPIFFTQLGGNTTIEASGVANISSYNVSGGTVTVLGTLDPATVSISGTTLFQGTGTVIANVAMTGGTMLPGVTGTPGTLNISGSYSQNGGTFSELISNSANGVINLIGNVTLAPNSALTVGLLGTGFNPAVGTTYSILDYTGTLTGQNFSITDPTFNGGTEQWVLTYGDTGGICPVGDSCVELEAESVTPPANLYAATWNSASGNWNAVTWNCTPTLSPCTPNNGTPSGDTYTATLDAAKGNLLTISSPTAITINGLTMTSGTLDIATGATLNLVNQPGGITDINANSGLILGGTFEVNGTTSALAGLISVEGTLTLANGQTTTVTPAGGTFTASGIVNVNQGSTLAVAGNLSNSGAITTGSDASGGNSIGVAGTLTNSGTIGLNGAGDSLSATGDFDNNAGGQLNFNAGNTAVATSTVSGNFNNNTGASVTFGASSTNSALTVTGAFNNSGGTVNMNGSGDTLTAGTITNSGSITLTGQTLGPNSETLTDLGAFTNNSGGSLNFAAASVFNNASVASTFTNGSGAAVNMLGEEDTLSVGSFANSGTVTMAGVLETVTDLGAFNNNSGGLLVQGNGDDVNVTGSFTNNGTVNLNGGTATLAGSNLFAASFSNSGAINLNGTGDLVGSDTSGVGAFNNNSGGSVTFSSTSNGSEVYGFSVFKNNTGANVSMNGTGDFLSANDFENSGMITLNGNQELLYDYGDFNNNSGGVLTFSSTSVGGPAAGVYVVGTFANNGGTVNMNGNGDELNASAFTNSGEININGTNEQFQFNTGSATFTNNTGGSITFGSTSNGSFIVMPGAFANNGGTITMNGTNDVLGGSSFTNSGAITVAGTNEALGTTGSGDFTNTGSIKLQGSGSMVSVGGNFNNNGGSVALSGSGDVLSATSLTNSGTVTIGVSESVTGTGSYTQSAGTTTVNGTLTGTGGVNINGGTLNGAASIPGSGTISGATIIGAGGTLLPGLSNTQSGTLNFANSLNISGTLVEVINSSTPGTGFGVLNIVGSLSLAASSTLNVQQLDTFDPSVGTILTIATTGSSTTGLAFGNILNDTFNDDTEKWVVVDSGDNVELEAETVTAPPGLFAATWNSASGNWTAVTWSCTPTLSPCTPNNGTPSGDTYTATLDSAVGNIVTISSPTTITINGLTMTSGTLDIASGATLNLVNQPGGITDINANSGLILGGTFEVNGTTSALAGLTSVEGTLTLANGQTTTVTPSGGTFTASGIVNVNQGSTLAVAGNLSNSGAITTGSDASGGNSIGVAGTLTNSGTIGLNGAGDSLTAGGLFNNSGSVTVGATATIAANGGYTNTGTTDVTGNLNTTTYQHTDGTTTIETGGAISAKNFNQTGGLVQGGGTINGAYSLSGTGTILPSLSGLAINGSYTQSGGTFDELIGPTGNGLLSVTGPATLEDSATLGITLLSDATLTDDEAFDLMNYTGTESGAFANAPSSEEFTLAGWYWDISYDTTGGICQTGDSCVELEAVAPENVQTPEPSALLLLAAGLLALGAFHRRKSVRVGR